MVDMLIQAGDNKRGLTREDETAELLK